MNKTQLDELFEILKDIRAGIDAIGEHKYEKRIYCRSTDDYHYNQRKIREDKYHERIID